MYFISESMSFILTAHHLIVINHNEIALRLEKTPNHFHLNCIEIWRSMFVCCIRIFLVNTDLLSHMPNSPNKLISFFIANKCKIELVTIVHRIIVNAHSIIYFIFFEEKCAPHHYLSIQCTIFLLVFIHEFVVSFTQ